MELTSSPVYRTDKTGQICNGLQADDHRSGGEAGAQQRHLQLRGSLALWPAAGMKTGAGHWTWVIGGQLPLLLSTTSQQSLLSCLRSQLLLLLCGYLRLAHGRQPATAGCLGHRPSSTPESVTTGGEPAGQQLVECSAKPKPKPKPSSASGPEVTPEPWVESADAAELTCQQECVICMDQPKSVFLAPCGHIVAYLRGAEKHYGVEGCLAMEGNMLCPLCRKLIRATVKAIYS